MTDMQTLPVATTESRPRLDYIDGLRGIAILLVLMTHAWDFSGAPALSFHLLRFTVVLAAIPAVGYIGVNLFLVLSGFCLAYPFMRDQSYRGRITIQHFWLKRIRRIVPAYYISILVVFAVCLIFNFTLHALTAYKAIDNRTELSNLPSLTDVATHLLFVHNLMPKYVSTVNGSYWSLALEFQLYLLFPLLIEMFFRWGARRTLVLILLVQTTYRLTIYNQIPDVTKVTALFVLPDAVFGRVVDFYLGILAAYLVANSQARPSILTGKYSGVTGLGILLTTFVLTFNINTANPLFDLLWALGFAVVICGSSCQGTMCNQFLRQRTLVRLGVASYSVYLIHQPIIERLGFIIRLFLKPGPAYILLTLCIFVVVALGLMFFKWVEFPLLSPTTQKAERQELSARRML